MTERADTRRTSVTALTYVKKAVAMLCRDAVSESQPRRKLAEIDATEMLSMTLWEIEDLVDLHNPEYDGLDAEKRAGQIRDRLRARRVAAKLADTTGRTPEEAATFRSHAARMRARS